MPAIILLVGGAIAWWASAREAQRMKSVEAQTQALCTSLARGDDLTGRLNPRNHAVEERIVSEMRRVLAGRDDAALVQVKVVSGDSAIGPTGSSAMPATHTAILHLDDVELLALRVHCDDPDEPIVVLGYVTPAGR